MQYKMRLVKSNPYTATGFPLIWLFLTTTEYHGQHMNTNKGGTALNQEMNINKDKSSG